MSLIGKARMRILVAVSLLLLSTPVLLAGAMYWSLQQPLELGDAPGTVELPRGTSLDRLAVTIHERGWMSGADALALRIYGRLTGEASRMQAGEYLVEPGATPLTLLRQIVSGQVIQYRLTIVEGWTFQRVIEELGRHPAVEQTLFGMSDEEIMAELGYEGRHPEGRFYPSTYQFPRGTPDRRILQRAYRRMERRLDEIWARRKPDLPLDSAYEALILASIVERETGVPEERRRVAGVFTRRLEQGMRLQTDPTVIYGLEEELEDRLRTRHLRTDTPYNTYTRHGLPPTPIAMPGSAAIEAAVDPEPGDVLYFVSRGDGSHHFSATLEEHNRAVRRYILGQE